MAIKKIQTWVRIMSKDSTKDLREISKNKYNMYAVNAVKASKIILEKRKSK